MLSAAGRQLAATTGRAFGDLSRALARQTGGSRRLRVSSVPIFASHWLLPRLGQFLSAHPEIELQVEASPRMADMEAGLVDVALRYGEGDWPDVSAEKIMALSAVPVAAPALARRLKLRAPSDLPRAPLIRVSPFGSSWTDWARGAGLDPARFERRKDEAKGLQVDGMGAALRAAAHGLGVALVFDPLVDSEIRSGALVRVGPGVADARPGLARLPSARARPAGDPRAAALAAAGVGRGLNAIQAVRRALRLSGRAVPSIDRPWTSCFPHAMACDSRRPCSSPQRRTVRQFS